MVRKGKDPWLHVQQIAHYVRTGKFLDSVTPSEKRHGIRHASKSFMHEGASVYYIGQEKDEQPVKKRLLVENKEEMKFVLHEGHDERGHPGTRGTQEKVSDQHYWCTITEDVREWVKNCPRCSVGNRNKPKGPRLRPIKPKGRWDVLDLDLIGPFLATERGNKYVLIMTDFFTKWVVAYPLQDNHGPTIARAIMTMIHTHGPPVKIVTAQGTELVNEVNKNILTLLNIKHLITAASSSRSNEQSERTNQAVTTALDEFCKRLDDWDLSLDCKVYGMNTSGQAEAKYTPFYLMYLRNPRTPVMLNALHASQGEVSFNYKSQPAIDDNIISDDIEAAIEVYKTTTAMATPMNTPTSKKKTNWTDSESFFLLQKMMENKTVLLGNDVASRKKSAAWEHVAFQVNTVFPSSSWSGEDCEKKYHSIKRSDGGLPAAMVTPGQAKLYNTPVQSNDTIDELRCTDWSDGSCSTIVIEGGPDGHCIIKSGATLDSPPPAARFSDTTAASVSFKQFSRLPDEERDNLVKYEQLQVHVAMKKAHVAMKQYYEKKMKIKGDVM